VASTHAIRLHNPDRIIKPIDGNYDPPEPGIADTHCYNGLYQWDRLPLGALNKGFWHATERGENLGLTDDEVAFYDALAANESAVKAMGDYKLKVIATELVSQVRKSVTIDWTLRESARARIRVMVKRILNKYGYPPDLQEDAVKTMLMQAELLCAEWV
jgi:hypothetical protein